MNLDLDARLTAAFIFGLVGLAGELVASLLGLSINGTVVGSLVSLVIATLGVGAFRGANPDDPQGDEGEA